MLRDGHAGERNAAGHYRAVQAAVIHVCTLPIDPFIAALDGSRVDDPTWEQTRREFEQQAVRSVHAAAALEHASPDLAEALRRSDQLSAKQRARTAAALSRYVNRMSTRPTLFGLMAAVTGAVIADGDGEGGDESGLDARFEDDAGPEAWRYDGVLRARARIDAAWRAHLIGASQLSDDDRIVTNDLIHCSAGMLWLEPAGRERRRWLRVGRPLAAVLTALDDAATPATTVRELTDAVSVLLPSTDSAAVHSLIHGLIRLGVLRRTAAGEQQTAVAVEQLEKFNVEGAPARLAELTAAVERERQRVSPDYQGRLVHVDTALRTLSLPVLPAQVGRLAETAADLLARLGRGRAYPAYMSAQADAFTERFGAGAWVPAPRAFAALGSTSSRGGRDSKTAPRTVDPRETVLLRLSAHALAHRRLDIELDDALLDALSVPTGPDAVDPRPLLPTIEISLRVARRDDGTVWGTLGVPTPLPAGSGTARLQDLLDPETAERLRELRAAEERATDRQFVELTWTPANPSAGNLVPCAVVRTRELPVNVPASVPPERVLRLTDVMLGVEDGRFALRRADSGEPLHLVQGSNLSLELAPRVCAFLLDVSANQFRHPSALVWGTASHGPFRPRLVRGDLVLACARWSVERTDRLVTAVNAADTAGTGPDLRAFAAAVGEWAATWMVPRYVYLLEREGRLLLDLLSGPSLALLHSALARVDAEPVVLEEALPSPDGRDGRPLIRDIAGNGYASEITVPLLTSTPTRAAPDDVQAPSESAAHAAGPRPMATPRDGQRSGWPGGQWLSLHLYLPDAARDRAVAELLPALRERLAGRYGLTDFFFIRYADPGDHLRIRIPLGTQGRRGVLDDVLSWAHDAADRLPVDEIAIREYRPEVDRYGGPELIGDAERLFCADSAAVCSILREPRVLGTLPRTVLGALTMAGIGAVLLPDPARRRDFVARWNADNRPGADEYRAHGRLLWRATASDVPTATVTDAGTDVGPLTARDDTAAHSREEVAVRALRAALRHIDLHWSAPGAEFAAALDSVARNAPAPGLSAEQHRHRVTASLLHLHANRLGLTRADESVARGIWRRLLDRALTTGRPQ